MKTQQVPQKMHSKTKKMRNVVVLYGLEMKKKLETNGWKKRMQNKRKLLRKVEQKVLRLILNFFLLICDCMNIV